jgi:hypothetical protein
MSGFASDIAGAVTGLLGGGAGAPAVRRPVAKVTYGSPSSAGASGGAFGGAVAAAASLLGGGGSSDPYSEVPVSLRADLGLAPHADVVELVYASARGPDVKIGDEATVSLGYADAGTPAVFKGKVRASRVDAHGARRLALINASATLSALRLSTSFEGQSAGDIVRGVAGEVEVPTGRVEAGPALAFYAINDGASAYAQIADLALQVGMCAAVSAAGELEFRPLDDGPPVQTFTYGQDVLSISAHEAEAPAGVRTFVGEGAAGSSGADAWCWLVKDPASVSTDAGSGAGTRVVRRAGLRSREAVDAAAAALGARLEWSQTRMELVVAGAPAIRAAAVFEVAGAPDGSMNGSWAAIHVSHRVSKGVGFVSSIRAVKAGAGGGAGGLLGAVGGLL